MTFDCEQKSGSSAPTDQEREAVREMLALVKENRTRLDVILVKELIRESR
ncbi:MAG: hypothetical protein WA197_04295 [Candidatus Acidiferrales bacterium]